MQKIYIIVILGIFSLTACQKVIDSNTLLATDKKVFISSFIAPTDTVLAVNVFKVLPAIGTTLSENDTEANKKLFLIKDAFVTMADDNGNQTELNYSEEVSAYTSEATNLDIIEGQQYYLKVSINGQELNASCTIPKKVPEITENIRTTQDDYGNKIAEIDLTFTDILGERNFYVLDGFFKETYEGESYTFPLYFEEDGLLNDALGDGISLRGRTGVYLNNSENTTPKEITLKVAHIDEIFYQYIQTSKLNLYNDGNPFVEYSISPSNILGDEGTGIFVGYQITTKVLELE